jgi:drug/metabolite transporter (DMT)-like permease
MKNGAAGMAETSQNGAALAVAKWRGDEKLGIVLVFCSALTWSFGGVIARFLTTTDMWTIVLWRSLWAAAFLIGFMLIRDGWRGTIMLFRNIGPAGLAVAVCFAIGSTSFIVALSYTTVANILLIQAGVPLIAALIAWMTFGEKPAPATWAAIAAVIFGVGVMVSDSLGGEVSLIGNGLAVLVSVAFALATVITRRHAQVRMTPAVCLATIISACTASALASGYAVSQADMVLLFAFGALNLGLGLACFVTGARLIPSAVAALIGTFEPVLGPIWVWLVHGETPSERTLLGGSLIVIALLAHLGWQYHRHRRILNAPAPK